MDKVVKYAGLSSQGAFVAIAVKSHGPINSDALQFSSELGSWRLVETIGDVREFSFFVSTDFRLRCNVFIRFRCTMVLLMTTDQSRVHYQTNFCNF